MREHITESIEAEFESTFTIDEGDGLSEVLEWIRSNLSPAQVFDEDELKSWAADNYKAGA